MPISFLHSSDWHIGKPFGRFGEERAGVLRRARLAAIDRIADACRVSGAEIVLVAGDLFDRPTLADREVREPIEQMRAHSGITWHVIPGNHDPAVTGGVWERVVRDGLPANIQLHLGPRPVEIDKGCWLLPAPLSAKAMSSDPTVWMDTAATPEGALRIGLAHGSVQGFGGNRTASITIAPDRPRRAGLDYLALGDWHGTLLIGPRAAYCGTPEPDGFLDNAPGGVLAVSIEAASAPPTIVRRETGQHRWLARRIEATRTTDLAQLEGEVEGWGIRARDNIVAVEVSGRLTVGEDDDLRRRLDRLEPRIFHLERRLAGVMIGAGEGDLARLGDGAVCDVARDLAAAASAEGEGAQVAARALRYLFELAERDGASGEGRR